MKFSFFVTLLAALSLAACTKDPLSDQPAGEGTVSFVLYAETYDGALSKSVARSRNYDELHYYIMNASGVPEPNLKAAYYPDRSMIVVDAMRDGDYTLVVLGVCGDSSADGAVIGRLERLSDVWLSFPEEMDKPVEAEYFYSKTPFSVRSGKAQLSGDGGIPEIAQKRIVGRLDISLRFNNSYVANAVESEILSVDNIYSYSGFSADSVYSGQSVVSVPDINLAETSSMMFMPTLPGSVVAGEMTVLTRRYYDGADERSYSFSGVAVRPNRIASVFTEIVHPDDNSGLIFGTADACHDNGWSRILQDGESKDIYANPAERSFNTANALQISLDEQEGRLHLRFYSPRDLNNVRLYAKIDNIAREEVEFAYFDTIEAFADMHMEIPVLQRRSVFRTVSGRIVESDRLSIDDISGAVFRVESDDPYWDMLSAIRQGWTIKFGLYGSNPDAPDGGPVGNWMGIRPVHCREAVAFFLNFSYLMFMDEYIALLNDNAESLYGNGGIADIVPVEDLLANMRSHYSLTVGLVYSGNGVAGLGNATVWGVHQPSYLTHYTNAYNSSTMFHELGHVLGYNHDSSFTYGPWAKELTNNFYIQNISKLPVGSPQYLNSSTNPNLYK